MKNDVIVDGRSGNFGKVVEISENSTNSGCMLKNTWGILEWQLDTLEEYLKYTWRAHDEHLEIFLK